jgi:hypothetical protein
LQWPFEQAATRESAKGERSIPLTAEISFTVVGFLAHPTSQYHSAEVFIIFILFYLSEYGDLAATIAAVLLHPEARSVVLDAYPFKGGLREPLLRLMALMRGMELKLAENQPIVKLIDLDYKIGEMAHNFRTVFSFFLPEYVPDGRAGEASLKAPEMMLSDMPKTGKLLFDLLVSSRLVQDMQNLTGSTLVSYFDKKVGLLNGVFSLVKYGLSRCNGGFGTENTNCNEGDFSRAAARLSYSRPYNKITATLEVQAENVVSELSTILTSGRLSDVNKRIIKDAYISKLNQTGIADPAGAALRMAQVCSFCL